MGWLDASDYIVLEIIARDRIDDLRSTIHLARASADGADETPHEIPEHGNPQSKPSLVTVRSRA